MAIGIRDADVVAAVALVQWLINTNSKTIPKNSGSFLFLHNYERHEKEAIICLCGE